MATDLITRAQYKAYAGINSDNQDSQIDALIPKVSQLVKTICRRTFVDYTNDAKVQIFKGGSPYLPLFEAPIIQVSGVEFSSDYGNTYTDLVEFTDWVLDSETEQIYLIGETYQEFFQPNAFKVTYTGGYETLPDDLLVAVLDLVTYYLKNDGSVHSPKAPGTNSVQIEYISTTGLPAHIKRVLDLYMAHYG